MKILNAAIIGCGSIHEIHADAISELDSSRLYAVCDINTKKAEEAGRKYSCRVFADYRELLQDRNIDVVHICTPHYLHAEMAVAAMKSGKHVLTEKPMSISVADALEMNMVSCETGKMLGVCFQNRYNASSLKMKETLQSGKAGAILGARAFVTWSRSKEYYTESGWRGRRETEGGGVLINQAIHTIDLMQWFMGKAVRLKAHTDTRLLDGIIEVEDTADAAITFENGSTLLFFASNNYAANAPIEIEIICEKAAFYLKDGLTVRYSDGTFERTEETDRATGAKAYWGCGHKALIRDFHDCVYRDKPFGITGEQGIEAIKIINAIYRSSESECYVEIGS